MLKESTPLSDNAHFLQECTGDVIKSYFILKKYEVNGFVVYVMRLKLNIVSSVSSILIRS